MRNRYAKTHCREFSPLEKIKEQERHKQRPRAEFKDMVKGAVRLGVLGYTLRNRKPGEDRTEILARMVGEHLRNVPGFDIRNPYHELLVSQELHAIAEEQNQ